MRSERTAPVDRMGACTVATESAPPEVRRFHTLVGVLLSSQTKDEVTSAAMRNLKAHGLTVASIRAASIQEIDRLICKVGFHKRKSKYLKQVAEILATQHGGDTPSTLEDALGLPGIGMKMAQLFLAIAYRQPVGVCVDTHVHRICNRLAWAHSTTPEETRLQLEAWLPRERWGEINWLFVGFGQERCFARAPLCNTCRVSSHCPYFLSGKSTASTSSTSTSDAATSDAASTSASPPSPSPPSSPPPLRRNPTRQCRRLVLDDDDWSSDTDIEDLA